MTSYIKKKENNRKTGTIHCKVYVIKFSQQKVWTLRCIV